MAGWMAILGAMALTSGAEARHGASLLPPSVHEDVLFRGEPLPTTPVRRPGEMENLAQVIYDERAESVVAVVSPDGQGSGTVLRSDGYILTCAHVFGEARKGIQVVLQSGTSLEARILAFDLTADLALLKVEPPAPLPWIAIGDLDALNVGDAVFAIGHPKGFGWSVNEGIVSNLYVFRDGRRDPGVIQTQVPLNPGNSGGPLLDRTGALMGVVAQGDPSAQALNWCISARAVKQFLLANAHKLPKSTLKVKVLTAGATILLNGIEVGRSPGVTLEVGAGPHIVDVRKDGMGSVAAPVVLLQRERAEVAVRLAPAGSLAVITDVPDVSIYVDGVYRGDSPLTLDLAEGRHTVSGIKAGSRNTEAMAIVKAEEETEIALSHPESSAYLTVFSVPSGAQVVVNGQVVGRTPVSEYVVAPGRHVVDVRSEGVRPRRMVVDVAESARRTIEFDLEPDFDTARIITGSDSRDSGPFPTSDGGRSRSRVRRGLTVMVGGIAVAALSAAVLTTQDDEIARGAAAASLVVGSAGFLIGPTMILREPQGSSYTIEVAPGASMSFRF